MKSKISMCSYKPEPHTSCTGLSTGAAQHQVLVRACKYRTDKAMCRLYDIHAEMLKHIRKVQGIELRTCVGTQLSGVFEGD
jgi:hypothetical protein